MMDPGVFMKNIYTQEQKKRTRCTQVLLRELIQTQIMKELFLGQRSFIADGARPWQFIKLDDASFGRCPGSLPAGPLVFKAKGWGGAL